jgi:hypothetical protein
VETSARTTVTERRRCQKRLAVLLLAAAVTVGCGDSGEKVAGIDIAASCSQLADARTPLERRVVQADLFDAIEEASIDTEDDGIVEVVAGLLDECPEEAEALLGIGPSTTHASEIELERNCRPDEDSGTATNTSDITLSVTVETRFYSQEDVLLRTSRDKIRDLRAGETGRWSNRLLGDDKAARCLTTVAQATPS